MNELTIRRYEDGDAASVRRLHHDGLHQLGVHAGDGPWDADLDAIAQTYLAPGGEFVVGVVGDDVIAIGALRRVSTTVAEIKRVRVDRRFQRRGYGRAIVRRLESRARELGYRTLRLDTTASQVPALRLYHSEGYVEVARTDPSDIVLEKQVAAAD